MARIDLNLLLVFEAILHERSVTRAGARLGLSQPAMSHALNRLRYLLKDQLFVRTPTGMAPTPRAERLAEPVRNALLELRQALTAEEFLPEHSQARFVIAVNNFAAIVLVAPILLKARALAPGLRLGFRPSGTLDVTGMLDRSELDIALLAAAPALTRFSSRCLIETDYVGVVRRGHPALEKPIDAKVFGSLQRLVISSSGDDLGALDQRLNELGLSIGERTEVPYLSAGPTLTQSDMIAVMGRQIADEFRRAYSVQLVELPVQPVALTSAMVWHNRLTDHPAHKWLREMIASIADALYRPDAHPGSGEAKS
ncbi:MAG: transcriptional regulator [Sphingomonas bacterium]|jgi:DNA-binding transcriptional LysR family regulator|uniref:LysR family transcriptional regulator n=1 Tax=Sphingomonas bacterium TaxID=1895847 RepID=UPI00262A76AB|nr:LysR family transcriptional regulator [Sphingomonas bacterium]MDB5706200.1 transcriptional regulator [Sphingomonas bacterium]